MDDVEAVMPEDHSRGRAQTAILHTVQKMYSVYISVYRSMQSMADVVLLHISVGSFPS